MNYSEARPIIRTFDLIAFRGSSLIGKVIRVVTAGDYSHVGLALRYHDRLMMMELKEGVGSRIVPLSTQGDFDWIETGLAETDVLMSYALDRIGSTPYSYANALLAGLGLNSKFSGQQCAQYCEDVYIKSGLLKDSRPDKPSLLVERVRRAVGPMRSAIVSNPR